MKKEKVLKLSELIKPLKNSLQEKKKAAARRTASKASARPKIKAKKAESKKAGLETKSEKLGTESRLDRPVRKAGDVIPVSRRETPAPDEAKWGLVLMGGGTRALAHIGVLEALLENDLMPPIITGTSMGAVIGGLFAAGYFPPELEKLSRQLSYSRLSQLRRSRIPIPDRLVDYLMVESYQKRLLRRMGLEKEDRLEKQLQEMVGDINIEDLSVRFGCNAVDLVSGREVNFTSGPLYQALRASLAFPFVIEPARLPGQLLVDGGLLNNCPVRLARELGATGVLVPDVHRPLKKMPAAGFTSAFIMVHRMVQVVLADSTESKLPEADLILKINPGVDTFDFIRAARVINLGRKITRDNIQAIKEMVSRLSGKDRSES
ncbi:MAG: patatin-like phospholipase family protein [Candidatus Saccharicenans sp.]|nr:patatin-like phospholipase family protein [Candidatus Saccharicenans sp.]